jgi:hypothetical protein
MPNRKTYDEREKVDHSSHPLMHRQPSDLKADIQDPEDRVVKVEDKSKTSERARQKKSR